MFPLQNDIFRSVVGAKPSNSRTCLFKEIEILPLLCQYTGSVMKFVANNQQKFEVNLVVDSIVDTVSRSRTGQRGVRILEEARNYSHVQNLLTGFGAFRPS